MRKTFLLLMACGAWGFVSGCVGENPPEDTTAKPTVEPAVENPPPSASPAPPPSVGGDDENMVQAIRRAAANVKVNSDGVVTEVDYRGKKINDEYLLILPRLSGLQSVLLNETEITDAGLETLGKIETLRNLDLRDCAISNDGLAHLVGLKELRALRLSGKSGATTVDDEGMESVGQLTNLKALLLDFLWVSGDGLAKLNGLENLEELYLAGTLVGDEDLKQVQQFPKLKKLRISKLSQVTGAGLTHVQDLPLTDLDLSENSSMFDNDLSALANMGDLERLNLWRVAMSDAGAAHLAGLNKMKWLNLDNTQLTDAGIPSLKDMSDLEFLHLGSTSVTDAGIQELETLKALKDLKVTRTAVTEAGVEELQKKLPDVSIQLKYIEGQ
ncbi:hypothetical protein AB1L42_02085 [Thalassoglobus sp. JC818]|uniref:leucine-rich repeat domain-containing protein n=1 Tax=Thalassoglobus sp. JC818 TaxID=3232136 RepID=UPI003458024C